MNKKTYMEVYFYICFWTDFQVSDLLFYYTNVYTLVAASTNRKEEIVTKTYKCF